MMAISKCHVNYVHCVVLIMYVSQSVMELAPSKNAFMCCIYCITRRTPHVIVLTSMLRCT
jgi:hypothetical protein